ncbi:MAG: hypothetical protein SGARI_007269 [Bacillariaceae sp.]
MTMAMRTTTRTFRMMAITATILLLLSEYRCQGFSAAVSTTTRKIAASQHKINKHVLSRNTVTTHGKGGASATSTSSTLAAAAAGADDSDSDDSKKQPSLDPTKLTKATKQMTAFTNRYLQNTDTKLCKDVGVAAVVIQGLAEHKVEFGSPLWPCRFYEDKEKEVKDGYWNCPCVPMREEKVCHCMLFLTEDNAFAGDRQSIDYEEVMKLNEGVADKE